MSAHPRAALGIGRSFQHLGLMMDESVETNVLAAQHLGLIGELRIEQIADQPKRAEHQQSRKAECQRP